MSLINEKALDERMRATKREPKFTVEYEMPSTPEAQACLARALSQVQIKLMQIGGRRVKQVEDKAEAA